MANLLGKLILDRYQVEEIIGEGGFGTIYLAYDKERRKKVAIKQNSIMDSLHQNLLEKEANLLASSKHPNLPQIWDYCCYPAENLNCLIIDFIQGENLGQKISKEDSHYPETQVYSWMIQICDAVSYLHNHKPSVLHLDIKPENIIVHEDTAMLIDFGFCAIYDSDNNSLPSAWAMSLRYAPPEQLYYGKKGLDIRSDIYSLGATAYTVLTRQYPPNAIERMFNNTITHPRQYNPNISNQTNSAILKAMQLDPELRFASVEEFQNILSLEISK